jgi:insulysin
MIYFLFFLLFQIPANSTEFTVIPNKATLPILTPSLSHAKTLKIRLSNGLEAFLFSDPEVDQSSAGLTVKVGSWDEPAEEPGLAHFLEHMLFLGTRKYPNESEYNRFVSEHGGQSNAFTAENSTSFMFSVDNKAFPETLDRFASFFKEPLFNPSGVSRELNAIDQEYAKNLNSDNFRELFVFKALADPQHPFHRFNMGNLASLSHVSQETLQQWYRSHYSANLMRLAIISPLPLEQLRDLVVADFKEVPNLNRPLNDMKGPLLPVDTSPHFIYIKPIKNVRTLTLLWDLPSKFAQMQQTKPDSIICYVLGHEGKGSLLAELKSEKLAESITCGSFQIGPNNMWLSVEVGLTDEGLKQVNRVIERCFQAITRFKEVGVPSYLFDEVKQLATINYQYQPRQDAFETIMRYATWLTHEEMETFPQQTQVIERFDPEAVQELLAYLTPKNTFFEIQAPEASTGIPFDLKEPWMGVPYALKPISPEQMNGWSEVKPHPKIELPSPNPFIPQHLDLVHLEQEKPKTLLPHPRIILEGEKGKFYFAPDSKFASPKIGWIIEIKTPSIIQGNAQQLVLGDLFVKCLKEKLDVYTYPATLAGLNSDLVCSENGLTLIIEGYSDKAALLLSSLLKQLQTEEPPSEECFKVYKASLQRQYQNFGKDNPVELAAQLVHSVLYKRYTTDKEKAAAIRKISYDQFADFVRQLFKKIYIQGVFYGNMREKSAKEISDSLVKGFSGDPYPLSQQYKPEVILLAKDKGPFYVEVKVPTQGNVAWLSLEAAPPFSLKARAAQQLIMQDLNSPFFAELRTKQQTGYLVFSGAEELERKLFSYFTVQSDTHQSRDLLARFELFIERYLQEIPLELNQARFTTLKLALIDNLKQSVKNSKDMVQMLYLLAFKYDADFDWLDKRIAALNELKYEECLAFAKELFGKENRRRIALLLNGENGHTLRYSRLGSLTQLRKLGAYLPR